MTHKKRYDKHSPSPSFEDAVSAVLNAPPTPEQQAKKDAAKARREERKRQTHDEASQTEQ